jgi:hypothetical protein
VDDAILTDLLPSSERSRTPCGEYPEHANGASRHEDTPPTRRDPSGDVPG